MKEIQLIFFDNCNTCNQEYHHYEFIYGHVNMCIDCYCKLTNKKRLKVVNSIKNFYKKIDDLGGEVIGKYINTDTKVDCICSNDHSCNPRPNGIQQGEGMCKICAGNDSETAKQNFYNNIKILGGTVIGEYTNSSTPVDCICVKGHACNPRPNDIQQGHGMCKICAGNDSETAKQNFYNNIKILGGTVIGEYTNSSTQVDCICKDGHPCNPNPNNINNGHGMCRICSGCDSETAKQNFYDNIKILGGTVIGEYTNSSTRVDCICKDGHPCKPAPGDIQQGHGMCRICSGTDLETAKQNFYTNIENLGGTVIGEYKGKDTPVNCICKNGHNCKPAPGGIQQGHGMCRRCCNSRGYSKKAISWLNSISNTIQHAENGGEFKIPNIGKVDGIDHETNTVYEYYGCFWHGCPKCFKSDYMNPINYKTASELYNKTIERSLAIRNAGYNLIEMWECD